MKTKSMVLLAMALGCGLVAMLGVQQILSSGEKSATDSVKVLVARQDIPAGIRIESTQVSFEDWPKDAVPPGAVTDAAQYEDRALKVRAFPGDVIISAKLGEKGAFGLGPSIPAGMRVVTVPVNMTTTHSGMMRPGDRVDVLVTYTIRRGGGFADMQRTKIVLEYIEVFAIDRSREGETDAAEKGTKAENLSLLVTPQQAQIVMLAKEKGKLQLALRSAEDKESVQIAAIDEKFLEDGKATMGREGIVEEEKKPAEDFTKFLETVVSAPPVAKEVGKEWAIEIYEGDHRRVEVVRIGKPAGQFEPAIHNRGGARQAPAQVPMPVRKAPKPETKQGDQ
jgi:pilus assembly protein CpaB